MSPGPDFAMITRNSLVYSRRTGIWSAVGLGCGISIHVAYSLVGIGLLIAKSVVLFSIIKYLGAGYLCYVGYKSLQARPAKADHSVAVEAPELSRKSAIKVGFLTNVLNPKASLFFLALFTQVISPHTPAIIQVFYGLEMSLATVAWFGLVAMLFSHHRVKAGFRRFQHQAERAFGLILIGLGIKIAFAHGRG